MAFQEAVKLDPAFGRAYINMASIYTNLKQDADAKTQCTSSRSRISIG